MKQQEWFVYILECLGGSYYVGMTADAGVRYEQHLSRFGGRHTGRHGVRRLAHLERYDHLDEARYREKQLKSWSRWKKEMLITGQWRQPTA
ncbi:MAG: GIY-YIG nuclease family protein [Patescibacteria group bacterium]